jgi:uncharacterized membrane protein
MRFIPFAMLAAAAGWLSSRWDDLPERWVIHWGPGGVPNGYTAKTYVGVFGPLLLAAALALFFELVAAFTERTSRARFPQLAHAYGNLVRWVSIGLTAALCAMAILLPSTVPPPPQLFVGLILGAVVLSLVLGGLGLGSAARKMAATGESLPKGYSPFLYRNPEDPRLIVPKIIGTGWTFNFAHPRAWLLLALLLLLPAIVTLLAVLATVK